MNIDSNINNLPIDLKEVRLKYFDLIILGKGTIYNRDDGSIALKMFIDKNSRFDSLTYLQKKLEIKAGEEISDKLFFKIEGKTLKGETFHCDKASLFDLISDEILDLELKDFLFISTDLSFNAYKIGKIIIQDEISIPKNKAIEINRNYSDKWKSRYIGLNIFETKVDEIDIDIITENGKTTLLFQSETKNFSNIDDISPIIASLGFISSSLIDQFDVEFYSQKMGLTKKIICPNRRILKMNYPPLHFNLPLEQSHNYCELFNCFYLFIKQEKSSTLESALRKVIGSVNAFISTYALTLTTSIETLAKTYFSEYARPIDSSEIKKANQEINKIDINSEIKNRVLGMLNSIIGQIRAKDVLVQLKEDNKISKEEYDSWTALRNSSAHGDSIQSTFQEFYNQCSINLMLFYKLIFHIIKYDGLFTNYSKLGYPYENLK